MLDGSCAIVTGAGSGLGKATAMRLAEAGVVVIEADARAQKGKTVGIPVLCDVRDPSSVARVVEAAARTSLPLRTVVNCAGIRGSAPILGDDGPHDLDLFQRILDINTTGTFNVVRLAAAEMARAVKDDDDIRGCIINTASIAAYDGLAGQAAYAASKAAVAGMTLALARDLAPHGIRVNAIAPGVVDSPMLAELDDERRERLHRDVVLPRRLGTPMEFARLVLSIAENGYLNGEVIRLDGALRMH